MNRSGKGSRIIRDHEIQFGTGKTWAQWTLTLDDVTAKDMSMKEIIAYLVENHELNATWAKIVAIRYKWGV
jgi:hypothetical protein